MSRATNCAAYQRGYDQEKALLDTIDAQRQSALNGWNGLAPRWHALAVQISSIKFQAQSEWTLAGTGNTLQAGLIIIGDLALGSLAPEAESIVPEAAQPAPVLDAVEAVFEFYNAIQAHYGDLDRLREWANEQSAVYDMSALLNMIDLLEQQGDVGGQMAAHGNQYNQQQGARNAEAQKTADAQSALGSCLANQH